MMHALGSISVPIHEAPARRTVLETMYRFALDHILGIPAAILDWMHVGSTDRMRLGCQMFIYHDHSIEAPARLKHPLDRNTELARTPRAKCRTSIQDDWSTTVLFHETHEELVDEGPLLAVDVKLLSSKALVELDCPQPVVVVEIHPPVSST
jgi:hypothetical protein